MAVIIVYSPSFRLSILMQVRMTLGAANQLCNLCLQSLRSKIKDGMQPILIVFVYNEQT